MDPKFPKLDPCIMLVLRNINKSSGKFSLYKHLLEKVLMVYKIVLRQSPKLSKRIITGLKPSLGLGY